MKLIKITMSIAVLLLMTSCASGYKAINPKNLSYSSNSTDKSVLLEYKYDLLDKKYRKKELAKGIRLAALKITNNSDRDLVFGKDIKLVYDDGSLIPIMDNQRVLSSLKQSPSSYLWYLLLTPMKFISSENNNGFQQETNSIPIGLAVGPVLAGGNMIAASSANSKFEKDLSSFDLNGVTIKKGETKSGLIGIRSDDYNAIRVKVK